MRGRAFRADGTAWAKAERHEGDNSFRDPEVGCSMGWVLGRTQAERGECRGTPAGYLRMTMSSVVLGPGCVCLCARHWMRQRPCHLGAQCRFRGPACNACLGTRGGTPAQGHHSGHTGPLPWTVHESPPAWEPTVVQFRYPTVNIYLDPCCGPAPRWDLSPTIAQVILPTALQGGGG